MNLLPKREVDTSLDESRNIVPLGVIASAPEISGSASVGEFRDNRMLPWLAAAAMGTAVLLGASESEAQEKQGTESQFAGAVTTLSGRVDLSDWSAGIIDGFYASAQHRYFSWTGNHEFMAAGGANLLKKPGGYAAINIGGFGLSGSASQGGVTPIVKGGFSAGPISVNVKTSLAIPVTTQNSGSSSIRFRNNGAVSANFVNGANSGVIIEANVANDNELITAGLAAALQLASGTYGKDGWVNAGKLQAGIYMITAATGEGSRHIDWYAALGLHGTFGKFPEGTNIFQYH